MKQRKTINQSIKEAIVYGWGRSDDVTISRHRDDDICDWITFYKIVEVDGHRENQEVLSLSRPDLQLLVDRIMMLKDQDGEL